MREQGEGRKAKGKRGAQPSTFNLQPSTDRSPLLGFELPNRPEVLAEEWARFDALGARIAKVRPYHLLDSVFGPVNRQALRARGVAIAIRPDADGPIDPEARASELIQAAEAWKSEERRVKSERGRSGDHPFTVQPSAFSLQPFSLFSLHSSLFLIVDSEPNLGAVPPPAGYWEAVEQVRARIVARFARSVRTVSPPLAIAQGEETWIAAGREVLSRFDYLGAHAYGQGESGLATRFLSLFAGFEQPWFVAELGDSSATSLGPHDRAGFVAESLRRILASGRVAACCLFILGTADPAWDRFVLPGEALQIIRQSWEESVNVIEVGASVVPARCYQPLVALCAEYGVDLFVIAAMVAQESGWNSEVIGDSGHSVGLLQLHDQGLGHGMTVAERQDPATNLRVGIRAFRARLDEFASLEAAIAAHNAGGPAVRQAGDWRTLYDGSVARRYVFPVLAKAEEYRRTGIVPDEPAAVSVDWRAVRIQLDVIWGVSEQLLAGRADATAWALRQAVMAIKDGIRLKAEG